MNTLRCPQCESPNVVQVDANRYECPYCGRSFNTQEGMLAAQQAAKPMASTTKKSSSKTTTLIIVVLLFVALLGGGWYAYQSYQKKQLEENLATILDANNSDVMEASSTQKRETPQRTETTRTNYQFTGLVNDKYEVVTNLRINGNEVRGKYYYMSTYRKQGDVPSTYITLEGNIDEYKHIHLVGSFYNSEQVEIWDGYLRGSEHDGYSFDAECVNDNGNVFHMVVSTNN